VLETHRGVLNRNDDDLLLDFHLHHPLHQDVRYTGW